MTVSAEARGTRAFTLVELLIVLAIIIILAGLIMSTSGYVQKKGARSRAEAEIAALSAAIESYKADNGIYPRDDTGAKASDMLDPRMEGNPANYKASSLYLYSQLSGRNADGTNITGAKSYFTFKPQMMNGARDASGNVNPVTGIRDPFGNNYGYSTANQADPTKGYNPTFDLWSTGGTTSGSATDRLQWVKNW